jgi:hypothetical protein
MPAKHDNKGSAGSVRALQKQVLSRRLRAMMEEKGLSATMAARLVEERLSGKSFNPVNIFHYRAGRSLPRPRILKALSDVFGVDFGDLALSPGEEEGTATPNGPRSPVAPVETASGSIPAFHVEELPGGQAWLQINQRLPWPTVIKILQVLKGGLTDRS